MYFLTVKEVAKELHINRQKVYDMINDHELMATKYGKAWMVDIEDLRKLHREYAWKDISTKESYEVAKEIKNVALATSPHNSSRIRKEKTK